MTKISIEQLQDILAEAKIAPDKQKEILENVKAVAEEEKAEKAQSVCPKAKNEFGVVLFDKDNVLAGKEFTAGVYQVKEGFDHSTVLTLVSEAARNQNSAAKRKKTVIQSVGDAFQNLKRKFIKDKGINLKTKTPVRVLVSNNSL
jgi:hypothetical protein